MSPAPKLRSTEDSPQLVYIATSKEEFERLEERAEKLFSSYIFDTPSTICIKSTGLNGEGVMVYPEWGELKGVSPTAGQHNTLGLLVAHTSEYFFVKLGETQYMIRYQNPDKINKK